MKRFFLVVIGILLIMSTPFAQLSSIQKKVEGMQKFSGYFTFYWDESSGSIWLEVDKFDREFLYVSSLPAGLGSNDIGLDRNQLGRTRVVKFERIGPKILLIQSNYAFRASSDNPSENKAVEDAFASSVIWGFTAAAEQEGRVLVNATAFIIRDAHDVISRLKRVRQGNFRLDDKRSAVYAANTKNFPENSEFEALLTFAASDPGNYVKQVAPDPGSVSLRQHHSFIKLPEDGYNPRIYDPRSNFISMSYMDFSTPVTKPVVKRFIERHRLKKKDPSAKVSEPEKPIVYYVDRGVPEPIRSALVEGGQWWNEAFKAIGYKNAFRVEVMPEGADPMDVRYNMVNWVHRSTRGWSYGAAVTDPRTGEIIKGHVALGSLRVRQDFLIAEGLIADYQDGKDVSAEALEMALARIRQLSCHEIGHTLGMGHNYAASVNDRASVMDYPHPMIHIDEDGSLDLSDAYDTGIGEWDKVSIAYGYQDFPEKVDEEKELRAILDRAFSRGLYFLAGQDARPGSAHPLAAVWDNGKNTVDELERVMRIRSVALETFDQRRIPVNFPLGSLEELLVPVYLFHRYQVEAAASMLGGLYYNHKLRGDSQGGVLMVPASEQKRALKALLQTIRPESLALDENILNVIHPRPPEYRPTRELFPGNTGLPFDPLGAAETAADLTLGAIFHPERAARMVEYHAREKQLPGFSDVLDAVVDFTWKSKLEQGLRAEIQRVVNNVFLLHLMRLTIDDAASSQVRALAALKLEELKNWINNRMTSIKDEDHKAHFFFAASQIELFQKDPSRVKLPEILNPPPGAPIGN